MSCIGNEYGGKSDIALEGNLTIWRLVVLSRPAWLEVILLSCLRDMFGWRILEYEVIYLVGKFKEYECLLLQICENSVCEV